MPRTSSILPLPTAIAAALAAALLVACGGDSAASLVASARASLAKHDTRTAIIQSKNALQADPGLGEARYLLGAAMVEAGDPIAGELELRKAQSAGYDADQVVPKLAAALLAQTQYKKVTDDYAGLKLQSPQARADLDTSLAYAYTMQGDKTASEAALKAALAADPGFAPAQVAEARFQAGAGDTDAALANIDSVLKQDPGNAEAWRLKGDILAFIKGDPDGALADYRKGLEANPNSPSAHIAVLTILLGQRKVDEADKQLAQLRKLTGNSIQTVYIEAMIAYLRKDMVKTRKLAQQLLKYAPESPPILLLAGGAELQGGSLLQAETYLEHALRLAPQAPITRRLLVTAYLRAGQPEKAVEALRPDPASDQVPPQLYAVAGEAYLQVGDIRKAEDFFSKATQADPGDNRSRTSLAMAHMMSGQAPLALTELQDIAASDNGTSADLALIAARMKRGEYPQALAAVDVLEKKPSSAPIAESLRGRIELAQHDAAAARKSFEKSATLAPNYLPPVASLAALDVADGKPQDARKRLQDYLVRQPDSAQALMALALVPGTSDADAVADLNKAIAAEPTQSGPRLQLIQHYILAGDKRDALTASQNAAAALPDRPDIVEAFGHVLEATGDLNQAITTFGHLAELQPGAPGPLLRLAEAQALAGSRESAISTLRKILASTPNELDAQGRLLSIQAAGGNVDDAVATARTVQQQRPAEPVGYLLEGDLQTSRKDWPKALAAYRNGLQHVPSSDLAVKVHVTLVASGDRDGAAKFAADWRRQHPDDAGFLFHLGDDALQRKDYAAAETDYLAVAKLQPNNAAAYNNLAWVADVQGQAAALGYAEKANQLTPDQPAFMDTLATVLAENKQLDRALTLQKRAVELMPANNDFKLNLARLYLKSGNRADARKQLDQLASLGDKFGGQAEVATLLKSL